ncbi:winged helix DNA-binding domain-containing protein [Streptomyces sp. NPDC090045]|uniref:winged helix DNA-binding domain-containing protein n=1 Tax=Streptomyces sp. NPDC090045 TaxID=3365927 RepID=UPI00381198CB
MQSPPVSWTAASARRTHRQGLLAPAATAATSPADIAGRMLGAHAQVMSAAELSIALRLDSATRTDVRDALIGSYGSGPGPRPGTLVKTFGPRGTIHLLPAEDLLWWTGALSALPARAGTLSPEARMTAAQTDEVLAAIGEALTGAELTVDELTEAIVARTGAWAADPVMPAFQTLWPRWRQVTHTAARHGVLAFGHDRGRKVTYTNPGCTPAPPTRSLHELVNRYLRAYGPATAEDFAAWLAAPKSWAATLFASLAERGRIEEVPFASGRAWLAAGDTAFPDEPVRGLRLLPYFDAYVVACRPRELLFPGFAATRALAGGQAGNHPVLLIDGTVAGVWHQRRTGRRIALTVEPLGRLSAAHRRALDEQVERTGAMLEATTERRSRRDSASISGHSGKCAENVAGMRCGSMAQTRRTLIIGAASVLLLAGCESAGDPDGESHLSGTHITPLVQMEPIPVVGDPLAGVAGPTRILSELQYGHHRLIAYVKGDSCGVLAASKDDSEANPIHLVSNWPVGGGGSNVHPLGPYNSTSGGGGQKIWALLRCSENAMVIEYSSGEEAAPEQARGPVTVAQVTDSPATSRITVGDPEARRQIEDWVKSGNQAPASRARAG